MSNKQICLIPYAHLDTQWRWEYPTTIKRYIKSTIDDNIAMLSKYPEYVFNFCGAIRYQMMKDYYPNGYSDVKKFIANGQWRPAGTCLDETDAIVPSVESLIRNVLYGRQWQLREFGRTSSDYMLPDCFGFPSNFPTVLKHCGIVGFSTQKLTWGSPIGIPFEIGKWVGADGSELLSALNPGSYVGRLDGIVQNDAERVKKLTALGEKNGVWKSFQYFGVGDMGGAPDEKSITNAIASKKLYDDGKSDVEVIQSGADQFFMNLSTEEVARLDTYSGDLLLTQHSAGSLSSQAIMKRWNSQNEQLAFTAEYYALLAEKVSGAVYPRERIAKAWQRVIGNQMHDILPGTCTPIAYEYSYNDEVLALKEWRKIIGDSIAAIALHLGGDGNIIIANPHDCARTTACELDIKGIKANASYQLKGSDGALTPCQMKNTGGAVKLVAVPQLKAFEIKRFSLVELPITNADLTLTYNSGGYEMRNESLTIGISACGEIYSIKDNLTSKELLKSPIAYHLQSERPQQYPAWNMDWKDRKLPPKKVVVCGKVEVIEDGAIRKTIRITTTLGKSTLVNEISLSQGGKTADCVLRIDWRERGVSLKLAVNANIDSPNFVTNWETCTALRQINNANLYEMPSRYWVDLRNDNCGLAILEAGKYGFDRPTADTMRMTLLYTPKGAIGAKFYDQRCQDVGRHTVKFSLYPHGASQETDNFAKALNRPLLTYSVKGECETTKDMRLFTMSNNDLGVLSVKKAEDDSGYIIRFYNRLGVDAATTVSFHGDVASAHNVNGIEEISGDLTVIDGGVTVAVAANAICTVLLKTNFERRTETSQKSVAIDSSCKVIGEYLPQELMPERLESGNIGFNILSGGTANAMECKGQSIDVGGGYNTVSILAVGKTACNMRLVFKDSQNKEVASVDNSIISASGFVGQFDKVVWRFTPKLCTQFKRDYLWINKYKGMKNGSITTAKIAHYTTHTHSNGQDQYYKYGYIQQLDIAIPRGAASMTLSNNANVNILAVTLSSQKVAVADIAAKVDSFEV